MTVRKTSGRSSTGQAGFTIVELLVSLVISSLIVLASAAFFVSSSRSRDTQDAAGLLQDNARFLTEVLTKNIQQAGYQNYIYGTLGATGRREVLTPVDGQPDVRGYNNTAAGSSDMLDNGAHDRSTNRVNNSDTLILRFQGSGSPADGSMVDCLGRPQSAPTTPGDRIYSVFEVRSGASTGNEPELRCKYYNFGTGATSIEPIVRGVETFQVMYGVDTNGDTFVDSWLNAKQVDLAGQWILVKSVRVGFVLRTPDRVTVGSPAGTYTPLGANFTQNTTTDPGSQLVVSSDDGRLRQVVTFTVNLRNQL